MHPAALKPDRTKERETIQRRKLVIIAALVLPQLNSLRYDFKSTRCKCFAIFITVMAPIVHPSSEL